MVDKIFVRMSQIKFRAKAIFEIKSYCKAFNLNLVTARANKY